MGEYTSTRSFFDFGSNLGKSLRKIVDWFAFVVVFGALLAIVAIVVAVFPDPSDEVRSAKRRATPMLQALQRLVFRGRITEDEYEEIQHNLVVFTVSNYKDVIE